MSEKDGAGPTDIANAKEVGSTKETMNPAKDATNAADPVNATAPDNTKKGGVSRNEAVLNEKDVEKAKHRGDQRDRPARKCGCACEINCNCKCTCACRDHCVCRIRPCDGNCGNRVGRNLVISIDGTSNQFGIHNTNVVELHSRILSETSAIQNKYYNCGIGTYVPPEAKASWKYWYQRVNNMVDLAIAINFKDIILKAYKWLSQTYLPGDKIFIFGFSRGAYQVRTLAAMIEKVGLVDSGNEEMIPFAYEIYTERHKGKVSDEAEEIATHFKNTFSRDVRVHFAGLWDTVSSVGLVRGKPLPLTWSAKHICIFRHALALDERRVKFLPEYVAGGGSSPASINGEPEPASAGGSNTMSKTSWDVKEVWFPGTHSDIGGGIKKNVKLNLSSVPLLWMENEATSAGLRLRPRAAGGGWNMSELHQDDVHESLRGFWRLIEHIPLKRLTYNDPDAVTRTPHRGNGRVIVPGQHIHVSVAFKTKGYTPRATFLHDTRIEWASFVGKEIGSHSFDWAGRLGNEVEMDLFDASFMIQAIDELRGIQPVGDSASNPEASDAGSYWIKRLEFMALSGQLAANYLAKLEQSPPEKKAQEVRITVDLFQKLREKHADTFDPDVATLLEYETGVLFGGQDVEGALHSYQEAQKIRLNIARANKASTQGIEILANCIGRFSGSSDTLKSNNDALTVIQDAVKSRQVLTGVDPDQPLANSLHYIGVVLRNLGHREDALQAATKAVGLYQDLARKNPTANPAGEKDLGMALHGLGSSLSVLGRHEEALAHKEEAVRLRRKLAGTDPIAKKDLASSLRNLGIDLSAVGRHQEALGADEQAVALCRNLVETDPTIMKDLVQSLHNLGFDFSALDRDEDAVHSEEEAVSRCRDIVGSDPSITKHLANSLHSLGFYLARVGRHEAAVLVTEDAVGLRRRLAETDSTAMADLLQSLHNLGLDLKTVGRQEDMLHATQEAIEIRRKLAETDPSIRKDLAHALHSIGFDLSAAAQNEDAVRVEEEAVSLWRDITETDPMDLANSLHSLGFYLSALGRPEVALPVVEEAVELRRKQAETEPAVAKALLQSLNNLSLDLKTVGRNEDMLHAAEEALEIRRKLTDTDPSIREDLAHALHSIGFDLSAADRTEDAVRVEEEAVALWRKIIETDPTVTKNLTNSLHSLAFYLSALGRKEGALPVVEEAVELRRKLAETDPAVAKDLLNSLHNLVIDLRNADRNDDALRAAEEAVGIQRRLAETDPTERAAVAQSLQRLGFAFSAVERHKDAVRVNTEAVELRRQLMQMEPTAARELASALDSLGIEYTAVGHHEDAIRVDTEAVELRRKVAETDPAATEDLSISLANLGYDFRTLSRYEDALRVDEEAVVLRRRLAEGDSTFSKSLASSLNSLGLGLSALGRFRDALRPIGEAVEIRRKLAQTDPVVKEDLAGSLHSLGFYLRVVGRFDEALAATEEAVGIRRELGNMESGLLQNLGFDLSAVNRYEDAVRAHEEAIELGEKVEDHNAATELRLASTLRSLSALRAVGHHEDASSSYERAAAIYRARAETDPEDTAYYLHELAVDLRSVGRDDALRAEEEATVIYRKLVQTKPALITQLVLCLNLLAEDFRAVGREEEAARVEAEMTTLNTKLLDQAPSSATDTDESQRVLAGTALDEEDGGGNPENDRDLLRALGGDEDAPRAEAGAIPLPEDTASERIDLLTVEQRLLAETPAIQENITEQTNAEGDDTPPRSLGHNENAERTDAETGPLPGTDVKNTAADPLRVPPEIPAIPETSAGETNADNDDGNPRALGKDENGARTDALQGTTSDEGPSSRQAADPGELRSVSPGTPTKEGAGEEEEENNREEVHDPRPAIGREEDPVRTDAGVPGLQESDLERIAAGEPSTVESHRSLADENNEEVGNISGGFGDEKDQEGISNGGPA